MCFVYVDQGAVRDKTAAKIVLQLRGKMTGSHALNFFGLMRRHLILVNTNGIWTARARNVLGYRVCLPLASRNYRKSEVAEVLAES